MSVPPRLSRIDPLVVALGPVAVALFAIWLGQSTSWDLRNYHWYNAYALLNGRMGFDMAVAHHATFYNPLIDLPLWWVAKIAPGWLAAAFLGALQGLNFSVLYLLGRDVLQFGERTRRVVAALLALLGITGGYALTLTGSPHYDNVVSVLVLASLWLIVRQRADMAAGGGTQALLLAGALIGLGVGLKFPTAPFGLAVLAAAVASASRARGMLRALLLCGVAAFIAFALSTGWWFYVLWRETGNPVFPYFNDVIGSTLILDASYRDTRFLPNSFVDALLFPFRASLDWRVSADGPLTDWRIAVAYAIVPFAALAMLLRRAAATPFADPRATRILFAFSTIGYVSWLAVFAIYRYLTPLEMLAPLLIVVAVGALPLPRGVRAAGAVLALLTVLALTPLPDDPRPAFAARVVDVDVPPIARPDATLALMTGVEPTAFAIPAFPPQIPFLRVDGYLVGPDADTPYLRTMRERIDTQIAQGGDVFVLFVEFERERTDKAMRLLSLRRTDECVAVANNLTEPLVWCRVVR